MVRKLAVVLFISYTQAQQCFTVLEVGKWLLIGIC